jgi:coenzyme F420-0:L-glutamate ligase/coenzyme F420-1:gamma-L-glutamate ligase
VSAERAGGGPPRRADSGDEAMPGAVSSGSLTGRLEVFALAGMPEIRPGADLAALLVSALGAASDVQPLRQDDVLVVTQKVVSKAEGAIVDLTTIQPRPEAVEFARRWDRDARQIEVVLQQARRIVRWQNGVLITETPHGFVCANGGVDASNMGPRSGSVATLLPNDPDASAGRIRAAVRAAFGVDVPVLVSDSFGRPWRWGIIDVAIGVSGMMPIDDLRGTPDADGRIMHSTIRATADEIATAAELAMGKVAGRPAAIVRGANPTRGEGRIADVLMPREFDLFP